MLEHHGARAPDDGRLYGSVAGAVPIGVACLAVRVVRGMQGGTMTDILMRCDGCGHLLVAKTLGLCPWGCGQRLCAYDLSRHRCSGRGR